MVCIYCGGLTFVINSRHQRQSNNIWRRRQCRSCRAIFTTHEKPDLKTGLMVQSSNSPHLQPFVRDKLFLSIYTSCSHRSNALDEASELTKTVIAKIGQPTDAVIHTKTIAATAAAILERFDPVAATVYRAYHPTLKP